MTTISEIARAADVSVESVLRVLNRDTVSSDVASRVLAAMDSYGFSRLRRAETAPEPDSPMPNSEHQGGAAGARAVSGEIVEDDRDGDLDTKDAIRRAREQLLDAVGQVVDGLENPESRSRRTDIAAIQPLADRMMLMEVLFDRLARDVKEMKHELGRARNERLEDLTLLVDLITTSWRGVDRRLARIDQKLERMEATGEPPRRHGRNRLGAGREESRRL
jgi:Bacterial regulatory proteins, lacI family